MGLSGHAARPTGAVRGVRTLAAVRGLYGAGLLLAPSPVLAGLAHRSPSAVHRQLARRNARSAALLALGGLVAAGSSDVATPAGRARPSRIWSRTDAEAAGRAGGAET